jgi:hypothetical protein
MGNKKPFVTKLGTARRVPKSRIWIEGKRLVEAGFTVGKFFVKEWGTGGADTLILRLCNDDDIYTTMPCKVSGKGEKPIIDITGEKVRETFGKESNHVEVYYGPGLIKVYGARK